ncbi:MAG: DUF4129 domain-containing protein [Chloroflexota bacterium]
MWSNYPPEPVPIGVEPDGRPAPPPSPPRPSRLLPVAQCVAEGGLLAVVAAALQALFGEVPIIGPLEFAILAGAGMGWARRVRWRGPAGEAFGLPVLAVAAGTMAWLLAPEVRVALIQGDAQAALAAHHGGWIGALAVLRGHAHQSRAVDEEVQDQLMRWGLPVVAVAWLIGDLTAGRAGPGIQEAFTALAFIGSLMFVGSGVLALGLARLAAVRGDGPGGGSWFGFVLLVALGVTVLGIPAALFLGVPLEALVVALVAPIRVLGALVVLLLSPVIILAALFIDLARGILPEGFGQGTIQLPVIEIGATQQPTSQLPGILFFLVIATIILLELAAVALYIWWHWRERRRMEALLGDVVEERSVVFDRPPRPRREPRPAAPARGDRSDPVGAYLAALDALAADGRWARRSAETPRQHLARLTPSAPVAPALARLAAGYQLLRYAGLALGNPERRRAAGRLERLERALREARST